MKQLGEVNNKELMNHHICFLNQNRGVYYMENKNPVIKSEIDSFDITFYINNIPLTEISTKMIYLPNWVDKSEELIDNTTKQDEIIYMSADYNVLQNWQINPDIKVKRVLNHSDLETFSTIQSWGFCETKEVFDQWYPWLRKKNFESFDFKNQFFYVSYLNNEPAGVSLIIENEGIYGIYAVATHPSFQKQGVATTTMKKALKDCIQSENYRLTLQVSKNSYAQRLYTKLGFVENFECEILKVNNN
jgi:ribosomal protein S18 acetylase RimI-like enzyme